MTIDAGASNLRGRRTLLGFLSLVLGAALWLPTAHLFFAVDPDASFRDPGLEARHVGVWTDPARREREVATLRRGEVGEWDFMWRTFTAWSLCNLALREPARAKERLEVVDSIIADTLRLEGEKGFRHFLLPYGKLAFKRKPERSQFVDGEIALMLALRRLVEEKAEYRPLLRERVEEMARRMEGSPVFSAESYSDECWTFCNAIALAAIRISDVLDGTDHSRLLRTWVEIARARLVEPRTGLLVSEYQLDGTTLDGPEGSSIWMVAHMLEVVDEDFARDQYRRAKERLGRFFCGFGFSREWPAGLETMRDIDAGAVVPILEAGAGGSGMAFVGAAAFGDRDYLASLLASLRCAAFPVRRDGELRYAASNLVGDATLLYAASLGPAWAEMKRRAGK